MMNVEGKVNSFITSHYQEEIGSDELVSDQALGSDEADTNPFFMYELQRR